MMKASRIVLAALLISAATLAQDSKTSIFASPDLLGPGEAMSIDGERVPQAIFRLFAIGSLKTNPDNLTATDREQVTNRLLYLLLLAREAERKGMPSERRVATEIELQRLETLARYMADSYAEQNPPTESELKMMYDANLEHLQEPQYKVRHILVKTEDEATSLIKQLSKGADFAKLAQDNSTDSSASDGGNLGWVTADSVLAPFAEALKATEPGKYYSKPVKTDYGWHVIKVDEKREQPAPTMDSIRDQLIQAVNAQKLSDYVKTLQDASEIKISK